MYVRTRYDRTQVIYDLISQNNINKQGLPKLKFSIAVSGMIATIDYWL